MITKISVFLVRNSLYIYFLFYYYQSTNPSQHLRNDGNLENDRMYNYLHQVCKKQVCF
jgi:hypothetical protein